MNIVSGVISFAQRAFALLGLVITGASAVASGTPSAPAPPGAVAAVSSDILSELWQEILRLWIDSFRRRVTRPLPPPTATSEELMLGVIDCYQSGGFPTFGPDGAPQDFKDAVNALYDLTLTPPPETVDPDLVSDFREVMVALGAS